MAASPLLIDPEHLADAFPEAYIERAEHGALVEIERDRAAQAAAIGTLKGLGFELSQGPDGCGGLAMAPAEDGD
jgi:hypothetical protein